MRRFLVPLLAMVGVAAAAAVAPASVSTHAASATIVISQIYGGGGNSGAPYQNDYVELFNRGTTSVSISGWSIQYASATGPGNFGGTSAQLTELWGSLAPGQYLLVQEASEAAVGAPLPTPDITDASPITMSATGAKVALVNTTTPLGCNGGSTPCSAAALATIVDLVGYGGADFFAGTAPAPTLSNTTAALRGGGGCTETADNAADFVAATPSPRNSSSALNPCGKMLTIQKAGGGSGTVTSADGGISCGTDCSELYPASTVVSLTATADANTTFTGWGGALTGKADPVSLMMDASKTVKATFKKNADLALNMTGPTSATVGTSFDYAFTATNAGPNSSSSVQVTDALPSGLTYASANPSQGTVSTSTTSTGATKVTWKIGTLASGGGATLRLAVTPMLAGTLKNTASITSSVTFDPSAGNNKSTVTTIVTNPTGVAARAGTAAELTSPAATPDATEGGD